MSDDRCDVAVVGAGPAGCAAALELWAAAPGLELVVLDRGRFPRDKICGDGIGPKAVEALRRLGVYDEERFSRYQRLQGVILSSPGRHTVTVQTSRDPEIGTGYVIPRLAFDAMLVEEVRQRGIVVREGFCVSELESSRQGVTIRGRAGGRSFGLRAEVAIVSWGARPGVVAVGAGRPRKSGLKDRAVAVRAYFEGLVGLEPYMAIHFDPELVPGYGWVFPTGPGTANIGYGIREDLLRRSGRSLLEMYRRFVQGNPFVKALHGASTRQRGPVRGAVIPFRTLRTPLVKDRLLFVGDAAGLADPLTGEGIGNALTSGILAGASVAEAFSQAAERGRTAALRSYQRECQRALRSELFCAKALQRFLLEPRIVSPERLLDAWIAKAGQNPRMARAMARLIIGDLPRSILLQAEVWRKLWRAWRT